eukprot:2325777-Rhodomonas_salina.1
MAASFVAGCLFSSLVARAVRAVRWCLQLGITACDAVQVQRKPTPAPARPAVQRQHTAVPAPTPFAGPQGAAAALSTRDLYKLYQDSLRRTLESKHGTA